MITVDTELGTIKVAKSVIGNIIVDVIDSFDGKVILSNSRGKVPKQLAYKLSQKDESSEISMELTEDGFNIGVFVVLKFGTSIKETTDRMLSDIRNNIKDMTGMEINDLTVTVTGVLSKKLAPRHIEVRG